MKRTHEEVKSNRQSAINQLVRQTDRQTCKESIRTLEKNNSRERGARERTDIEPKSLNEKLSFLI